MVQAQLEGIGGFGLNKSSQLCYQWANVEGEHWNFYIKMKSLPLELLLFEMSEKLIIASACREILFSKTAQTYFRLRNAYDSQIERNSTFNFCKIKMKIKGPIT